MVASHTAARLFKTVGLALSFLLGTMVAAEATTIFTEDFSGATQGQNLTGNLGSSQFAVTSGNVDVLSPTLFGCVGNPGGKCVDLIGGGSGAITSTVSFNIVAGNTYTIQYTDVLQGFATGNTPTLGYTVALGGTSFAVTSIPTVTLMSLQFIASVTENAALLVFAASGGDGSHGPVISNITVDALAPTVPVPGALPLFATALAGLGIMTWRRRRSAA